MGKEDEEIKKAVEEVDRYEDEEAAKRQKDSDEYKEKDEDVVIICPKCKRLVTEADFVEDELSDMMLTSLEHKIYCSNCGYTGLPIEMGREDYRKLGKEGKKPKE